MGIEDISSSKPMPMVDLRDVPSAVTIDIGGVGSPEGKIEGIMFVLHDADRKPLARYELDFGEMRHLANALLIACDRGERMR